MGNVYHTKEEMIDCVNAFYEGMVQRSEEMKRHPNYKTGENYAYLGLPPCFLIFDEYVAFFEMLGTKESVGLLIMTQSRPPFLSSTSMCGLLMKNPTSEKMNGNSMTAGLGLLAITDRA